MVYTAVLRRNRQNRTNYRKRVAMLIGRHSFVSITVSNQNIMAQVLKPLAGGDSVVTAVRSRELLNVRMEGLYEEHTNMLSDRPAFGYTNIGKRNE